eukprot:COSAG05_NODE_16249_length_350_cov_0.852590_1_plen_20_part_10
MHARTDFPEFFLRYGLRAYM